MSAIPRGEGKTDYLPGVKCTKFFCWRQAVYKKLIRHFPCCFSYEPRCNKHK